MAKKKNKNDEFSFEESFHQLEEIVERMEEGNLSLSDSLSNYELGIRHLKNCFQALDRAEQKIKQLAEFDEDGNLITSDFQTVEPDDADDRATPRKSSRKKSAKKNQTGDELF